MDVVSSMSQKDNIYNNCNIAGIIQVVHLPLGHVLLS